MGWAADQLGRSAPGLVDRVAKRPDPARPTSGEGVHAALTERQVNWAVATGVAGDSRRDFRKLSAGLSTIRASPPVRDDVGTVDMRHRCRGAVRVPSPNVP